jgi:copper chaperone CopZ
MKKIILISMAMVLSLTISAQNKKKTEDVTYKTSINCDKCVTTIMTSLPLEKGIKDVKCDLETKEVKVTFRQDKTDKEKVKRLLEKLGFTAVEEEVPNKEKTIKE